MSLKYFIVFAEAHPTDTGALHCCSRNLQEQIRENILEFDPTISQGEKLSVHRQKMMEKKKKEAEERNVKNKTSETNGSKSNLSEKKDGKLRFRIFLKASAQ